MDLLRQLTHVRNLHLAFERTKNGVLNKELYCYHEQEAFESCIPKIYDYIAKSLKEPEHYKFSYMEVLKKPKKYDDEAGWETRPLVRMNFMDAVVIQAVTNIIAELVRPVLASRNYGNRLSKEHSSKMYEDWIKGYKKFTNKELEGAKEDSPYKYVVEIDIKQFYPNVDHELLLKEIERYIVDVTDDNGYILLKWLKQILNIEGKDVFGNIIRFDKGLPQGPLHSPLLASFYLKDCFKSFERDLANVLYFAYVDDFRFYCETEEKANLVKDHMVEYLNGRGLEYNEKKTSVKEVSNSKIYESKLMSKASNFNRAIRNHILMTSQSSKQMKENLLNLLDQIKPLRDKFGQDIEPFSDKLTRFLNYRQLKLIDSSEEWNKYIDDLKKSIDNNDLTSFFTSNFAANLHMIFIGAKTVKDRNKFLDVIIKMLGRVDKELTYVKYVLLQYCFIWSQEELRLPETEKLVKLVESNFGYNVFLKAMLSRCHPDWYNKFPKTEDIENLENDIELWVIYARKDKQELPSEYGKYQSEYKLRQAENALTLHASSIYNNFLNEYLNDERLKSIEYWKFERFTGDKWEVPPLMGGQLSLDEFCAISKESFLEQHDEKEYKLRKLLTKLFRWLDTQLSYGFKVPVSVINPEYIWFDENVDSITLYGNIAFENESLYYEQPYFVWQRGFRYLFEICFNLKVDNFPKTLSLPHLMFWQFRLIELLDGFFELGTFVKDVLTILDEHSFSKNYVDSEHFRVSRIMKYYISDPRLRDKLLEITRFVQASWENGSKDCYFFTLHNHEHARKLIQSFHEINEHSRFSIFINQKEAFRLFSACYLHDIGMLSGPEIEDLYANESSEIVRKATKEIVSSLNEAAVQALDYLVLRKVYDIHTEVEKFREEFVRSKHAFNSGKEVIFDYPKLPLTVAERRDIAIICDSHGREKNEIENLMEKFSHDERHPIRLKLLSHLLRLIDFFDTSHERISTEVLERNFDRMSKQSLFHWVKHLSVNRVKIRSEFVDTSKIKVFVEIEHNHLPRSIVPSEDLRKRCKKKCKNEFDDKVIGILTSKSEYRPTEENGIIKYLDADECSIVCRFINLSYHWFFAETIYFNRFLKDEKINVELDLSIVRGEDLRSDFDLIKNRNQHLSAQEFMIDYLLKH